MDHSAGAREPEPSCVDRDVEKAWFRPTVVRGAQRTPLTQLSGQRGYGSHDVIHMDAGLRQRPLEGGIAIGEGSPI